MSTRVQSPRPGGLHRVLVLTVAYAAITAVLTAPALSPTASAAQTRAARTGTLTLSTAALVPVGDDVLATATSRPARPGAVVRLEVRRGGTWVAVARARQDGRGVARLRLPRPAEGLLSLRAVRSGGSTVRSTPAPVRVAPVDDQIPPAPGQETDREVGEIDVSSDSRIVTYTAPFASSRNGGSTVRTVVHDRLSRSTTLLPLPAGSLSQRLPAVSPGGRYVATVSAIGQEQSAPVDRVTLTDLQTGRTTTIPSPLGVRDLDVSSDGQRVVMTGYAWPAADGACVHDLSQGGERENDVYLLDRSTGRISCPSSGLDGRLNGGVDTPELSLDASVVTFGFYYRDEPNGDFRGELVRWQAGRRQFVRTPFDKAGDHTDRAAQVVVRIPRLDGPPDDLGLFDVATGMTRNLTAYDDAGSFDGYVSADGGVLWYAGNATDAASSYPPRSGPNPGCTFRRDTSSGATVVAFCGTSRNAVAISDDGRFIAADDDAGHLLTRFYSH